MTLIILITVSNGVEWEMDDIRRQNGMINILLIIITTVRAVLLYPHVVSLFHNTALFKHNIFFLKCCLELVEKYQYVY